MQQISSSRVLSLQGRDGKIYRALETADIMVVETPAYYDSISAQLKLVIDRSNCFGNALRMIRLWFKDANIELAEVFTVMDADRGEGARNRVELLRKAFELGVLSVEASGKTNTNHAL